MDAWIEDVHCEWQFIGIDMLSTFRVNVTNGHFINSVPTAGVGIRISGVLPTTANQHAHITDCEFVAPSFEAMPLAAIQLINADAVHIAGVTSLFHGNGLLLTPGGGQRVVGVDVANTYFDNGDVGITVSPTGTGNVWGLACVNCWTSANRFVGVFVGNADIRDAHFIAHRAILNNGAGLWLDGGRNVRLVGCGIYNNSNAPNQSCTQPGIYVGPGLSHFIISNCRVGRQTLSDTLTQKHAIRLDLSSDNYIIEGNDLSDNCFQSIENPPLLPTATKIIANNIL